MKLIFKMLLVLGFIPFLNAQSGINYKALIKDVNGNVLVSSPISIEFIIYEGAALTNDVYQESHTTNTDTNGFVILNIGEGISNDDFNAINWGDSYHFLNVKLDIGSGLVDLGTTQFMAVPYALLAQQAETAKNVTGVESINEGNGSGWRLIGANSSNYGNIGNKAVDLSYSNLESMTNGALGSYSIALNRNSEASGISSFATGVSSKATGINSIALGAVSQAQSLSSVAIGNSSIASGDHSITLGRSSAASGENAIAAGLFSEAIGSDSMAFGRLSQSEGASSIAIGLGATALADGAIAIGQASVDSNNAIGIGRLNESNAYGSVTIGELNVANGNNSVALGRSTFTQSYAEIVVGLWNTLYVPNSSTAWNTSDRVFVVGAGSGSDFRRNAMTILKSGRVGIGTDDPLALLHLDGTLRIGDETISDAGNNALLINSALIPEFDDTNVIGNSSQRWRTVYAVNGTINTSDKREKKNIKDISYGLAEILQMQPVSFNWKNADNPDVKLGLIAQDLQTLIPEVVKTHAWETDEGTGELTKKELDRLGVYYSDLVPVLIKAIQEQNKVIENQSDELKASSKNYKALLSRIEQLESKSSN